jgi:acetyltransferase
VLSLVAAPGFGRWLTAAPLRLLGTLSYGIYLWHYPAIRFFRAEQWWPMDGLAKFALVFGFAAGAAAISWYCVERPVLRWSGRVIERRRERSARSGSRRPMPSPARA